MQGLLEAVTLYGVVFRFFTPGPAPISFEGTLARGQKEMLRCVSV
jgi:hypothetical protein